MHIFVYGTLRPSLCGDVIDRFSLKAVGPATLFGHYRMYDLGRFPCLVETKGDNHTIVGELVEVEDHTIEQLDRYEGCHQSNPEDKKGFYYRAIKTVRGEDPEDGPIWPVKAWVYFQREDQVLNSDGSAMYPEVPHFDWGCVKTGRTNNVRSVSITRPYCP